MGTHEKIFVESYWGWHTWTQVIDFCCYFSTQFSIRYELKHFHAHALCIDIFPLASHVGNFSQQERHAWSFNGRFTYLGLLSCNWSWMQFTTNWWNIRWRHVRHWHGQGISAKRIDISVNRQVFKQRLPGYSNRKMVWWTAMFQIWIWNRDTKTIRQVHFIYIFFSWIKSFLIRRFIL